MVAIYAWYVRGVLVRDTILKIISIEEFNNKGITDEQFPITLAILIQKEYRDGNANVRLLRYL